ncbi:15984_t:CDS:1, partial [Funneliformis caledonium]
MSSITKIKLPFVKTLELFNTSSTSASITNQAINDTTSLQHTGTLENFNQTVVITVLVFGHIDLIVCSLV